jgi:fatty-acyl-CoA synthase
MIRRSPEPASKHATLVDALVAAAGSSVPADGLVFVGLDERERFHAWADIYTRAQQAAATLAEAGVEPGDRVAIVLPTSIHFMDAFFGSLLAGAVPVPLYPPVRLGRLEEYQASTVRMLRSVGAKRVVVDDRVRVVLGGVVEGAECEPLDAGSLIAVPRSLVLPADPDALGLIQFSSGSTVDPKAVALTHRQLLAQCAMLHALMQQQPGNTRVGASWLPLYHDMGLIGCLLSAVYHPGRLVLIAPEHFLAKPALWLRAISRHRAFISPAPNFAYSLCAKRVRENDLAGVDLSCWRLALNGAEPVLATTLDEFVRRFAPHGFDRCAAIPVYGLSEAALAVTASPPGRPALRRIHKGRDVVSVGQPVPGMDVEIRDESGREVQDGVEGRIFVRGPSVMKGYFADPIATARVLRDRWLDTGDLGFVADQHLYVSGRAKDVIIVRGANRMPQEFEEPLLDVDGIRTGCVVAVGELFAEEGGEGLLILAERANKAERRDDDVTEEISARLAERTGIRPSRVEMLEPGTLPRTSSGKLRRGEALRRFREGALDPGRRVNVLTMSGAMLRSALAYRRFKRARRRMAGESAVEARD